MKRGEIVTIVQKGEYGKPRPALIIQSNFFDQHPSVTVLPITSEIRDTPLFRVTVEPHETNGLRKISQIMVDKITTVSRDKIGTVFGNLDEHALLEIERCLALFLGLAK